MQNQPSPTHEGWHQKTRKEVASDFKVYLQTHPNGTLSKFIEYIFQTAKSQFTKRKWRISYIELSKLYFFTEDTGWIERNQKKCILKQTLHIIKRNRGDMISHMSDEGYSRSCGVWEDPFKLIIK